MATKTKIALNNLGCSKNLVDGENIMGLLQANNMEIVDHYNEADVIIVNTCAFIQEAKQEAIDAILSMASFKSDGKCELLIVSGCFSERYRKQASRELPEVDLWVGVDDWAEMLIKHFDIAKNIQANRALETNSATQHIKIAEGCSHSCAFCAIPLIRGKFRSRSTNDILREAKWLEEEGTKECILVSQDTSFYGRDTGSSLMSLLELLLKETGFHWIRMMYLHPNHVTEELLRLVAGEKRICSYFDIPLQHISDRILQAMGRRPGSDGTRELVENIRTIVPHAGIRSAFVLGFPGETERHFTELIRFIEWARFEKVGVFAYSPEEGTPAFGRRPLPRTSTASRRCDEIMNVQREISREINEDRIGERIEMIVDDLIDSDNMIFEARTSLDAPEVDGRVLVKDPSCKIGGFVKVKITGADDYDLYANVSTQHDDSGGHFQVPESYS